MVHWRYTARDIFRASVALLWISGAIALVVLCGKDGLEAAVGASLGLALALTRNRGAAAVNVVPARRRVLR
jgi:hypothetical protein